MPSTSRCSRASGSGRLALRRPRCARSRSTPTTSCRSPARRSRCSTTSASSPGGLAEARRAPARAARRHGACTVSPRPRSIGRSTRRGQASARAPANGRGADASVGLRPFWLLAAPAAARGDRRRAAPRRAAEAPRRPRAHRDRAGGTAATSRATTSSPQTAERALVWVYRERRAPGGWFLHGVCLRDMLPAYAELHCLSNFTFLRGASHPEELVAARARARLRGARHHRRVLARRRRARARRGEGARAQAHRRHARSRLDDGPKLVLLAHRPRRLRQPLRADHPGAAQRQQGQLPPDARRSRRRAGRLPRAAGPGDRTARSPAQARLARGALSRPRLDRGGAALRPGRPRAARRAARARRAAAGLPLVAAGDVHMHVRSRRRAAGRAHRDPPRPPGRASAAARCIPNGERHLRAADAARAALSARAARRDAATSPSAARFSLDELRYEYPEELVPAGRDAGDASCASSPTKGLARRFPGGAPDARARASSSTSSRSSPSCATSPTSSPCTTSCASRARAGILCQGRGSAANSAVCYALGITEVDPGAHVDAVRALHLARAQRAARHRRRLRARAARGGDPVHLRASTAASARRSPRPSSPTARRARCATSARRSGLDLDAGGPAGEDRLPWWDGRAGRCRAPARGRLRSRQARRASSWSRSSNELVGFPRHLSQHVGGFVIARGPLSRLVPIENAAMPERTVIQWDKDDLDALGLLKVDVLALGHAHRDPARARPRSSELPRPAVHDGRRAGRGPGGLRDDPARRHDRRVPDRVARADGDAAAPAARAASTTW